MRKILFAFIAFLCWLGTTEVLAFKFDLTKTPFSIHGSYMAVSPLLKETVTDSLFIHDVSGSRIWKDNRVFLIQPTVDGKPAKYRIEAGVGKVSLLADKGTVELCFENADVIRIRCRGIGVRISNGFLDQAGMMIPVSDTQFRFMTGVGPHYLFSTLSGKVQAKGNRTLTLWNPAEDRNFAMQLEADLGKTAEIAIEQYVVGCKIKTPPTTFDACVDSTLKAFAQWMKNAPKAAKGFEETNELAQYINWMTFVNPRGFIKRPALFMSKNHMHGIWSWDHCFNAMGLAKTNPHLAWEQYVIMFDYQNPQGALPDLLTDNHAVLCYTKPPIHGWTLRKLMENPGMVSSEKIKEMYPKLEKETSFWMQNMDDDTDGVPQYNHGFDSGWDNSTVFDIGMSVESPDLSTFLIIQMDVLQQLATTLHKKAVAKQWEAQKNNLLSLLVAHSWNGRYFDSKRSGEHQFENGEKCLLSYFPLLLGNMLPDSVLKPLVKSFKNSGLMTETGLATESPASAKYSPDGYWRGPIWAPTTILMVEALEKCGEKQLAKELALKFCNMCRKNGFAENYDALTGKNLRCQSYTWTTSVYLILENKYAEK